MLKLFTDIIFPFNGEYSCVVILLFQYSRIFREIVAKYSDILVFRIESTDPLTSPNPEFAFLDCWSRNPIVIDGN